MIKTWIRNRKLRKQKEFAAKLKWGNDWHYKLYPHKYTRSTGPR